MAAIRPIKSCNSLQHEHPSSNITHFSELTIISLVRALISNSILLLIF